MNTQIRILMASALLAGLLAACGEPTTSSPSAGGTHPADPYHFNQGWKETTDDGVYTYTDLQEGKSFKIEYANAKAEGGDDAGESIIMRSFDHDKNPRFPFINEFKDYKKLVITGKLEATAGTSSVTVRIIALDGTATLEHTFELTAEESTHEYSITGITDWQAQSGIAFIVNRGADNADKGTGVLTFTDVAITKTELVTE